MKKILLIYGGCSFEHDISVKSYNTIINNIDYDKYIVESVYITKDNIWYHNNKEIKNILEFISIYDVVFPVMHGKNGEDGLIQGMLELFNINYIGSKCGASYICMDKIRTKEILSNYNIPLLPYEQYNDKLTLDYPVIIKPANGGSSIGISIAHNDNEFNNSISESIKYDNKLLIEKYIDNPIEYECACLKIKDEIIVEVGQIMHDNTFYDYKTKYENDKVCTNLNPAIDINIKNKLIYYSKQIFNILELKDLARIDFLFKDGYIYFNEVNTIPGFTDISMYPSLFNNINISIKDLIDILINNNI